MRIPRHNDRGAFEWALPFEEREETMINRRALTDADLRALRGVATVAWGSVNPSPLGDGMRSVRGDADGEICKLLVEGLLKAGAR